MSDFQSTDDLREFILNRQEHDEDVLGIAGHCWGLSWKKDRWVVKSNNKKAAEITSKDVPNEFEIKSDEFACGVLAALRRDSIDGMQAYLNELNNA